MIASVVWSKLGLTCIPHSTTKGKIMLKKRETFVGTFSEAMAFVFQNNLNVKTKENKQLQAALAEMLANADEDCPSQYRTKHFRNALKDGYSLLKKMGYFERRKNA